MLKILKANNKCTRSTNKIFLRSLKSYYTVLLQNPWKVVFEDSYKISMNIPEFLGEYCCKQLEAVNYYHKALHLGCCSSPRSAFDKYLELKFSSSQVNIMRPSLCISILSLPTDLLNNTQVCNNIKLMLFFSSIDRKHQNGFEFHHCSKNKILSFGTYLYKITMKILKQPQKFW